MKLRTVVLVGVMCIAGLSLIGSGAHAGFTVQTTSRQTITIGTPGTPKVVQSSPAASSGNGTKALTLTTITPTGPSFTTGDEVVTITNNGTFAASNITETLVSTQPGSALASQLSICEVGSGDVIFNGPLSEALDTQAIVGVLAVGGSYSYTLNIYAGDETTACGAVTSVGAPAVSGTSTAPALNSATTGESITATVTVGYSG